MVILYSLDLSIYMLMAAHGTTVSPTISNVSILVYYPTYEPLTEAVPLVAPLTLLVVA